MMNDIAKVKVGDQLPTFIRKGTVDHWNRFAAVNYEYAPPHWDYEVAQNEGFDAPFAMAPLQLAFFHAILRDWMGQTGRIIRISAKLKGPFFKDTILTVSGKIKAVDKRDRETFIDLDLAQIDDGDRSIAIGEAQIAFP